MICPACQRRLHVDALAPSPSVHPATTPLNIEGVIRHPGTEAAWEYSVVVEVRDQQGKVLARRVVGVGAIHPGDSRGFALRVEMHSPAKLTPATASARPSKAE
ncbi:MAG TPA: hypothetical protein VLT62_14135 [Candidatus Methylomirabilis sp.]|nr:hypothetical protein [Candidatus Methylomirabilis sp.]